ncbi:hypothetical protein [Actinoallomurus sp. NPDC052274]|uniref:hypothetical protein n=1 Tax=Actinoallomurus sp. NPDC052274 TaxID=3155420 RepID=UPI0034312B53
MREESGPHLPSLTIAGYARFRLTAPPRTEYAALYAARTEALHREFVPNREADAIASGGELRRCRPQATDEGMLE